MRVMSAVYEMLPNMAAICDIFVFATGQLGRLLRTLRCDSEEVNPKILGRFRRSFLQQGIASVRAVRNGVSVCVLATAVKVLLPDLPFIFAFYLPLRKDDFIVVKKVMILVIPA